MNAQNSTLRYQVNDFFHRPNMVGDTGFHRGRNAQGLVNPAEVVMHEMNRGGVLVVLQLLAECVGETRKSSVAHAEGEVLPFNMTGGDKDASRNKLYTLSRF